MKSAEELPPQVMRALNAGRKIEAIKLLREARGIGLAEAKDTVDSVVLNQPPVARPHRAAAKNDSGITRLVIVFVVLAACLAGYFYLSGSV